ncbi:MAG: metallophosphoesterase [Gemmatimonadota bacterium]
MGAAALREHFEPKFEQSFAWLREDGVPAFLALGNHDWRSAFGAECEIGYSLRRATAWRLPFYFYRIEVRAPDGSRPLAEILVLYSAPAHGDPRGENHARIGPRQRAWLARALARPAGGWRLAASHHPVWSAGGHTFLEFRSFHTDLLDSFLSVGARADLLLAGHNHWQESVRVPLGGAPALQVVSGALSKVAFARMLERGYPFFNLLALNPIWRAGMSGDLATDPGAFLRRDRAVLARGFALVELGEREGSVRFFGTAGELYAESFTRSSTSRSTRAIASSWRRTSGTQRSGVRTAVPSPATGEQRRGVSTTRTCE